MSCLFGGFYNKINTEPFSAASCINLAEPMQIFVRQDMKKKHNNIFFIGPCITF